MISSMRTAALFLCCCVGLSCAEKSATAKARLAPLVEVQPAKTVDVPVLARAHVELRPLEQAEVSSKTIGYLDAVLVDRGDVVKKGQLLALVRPSDLPDQLLAAKSAVSQAQASQALARTNLERAATLAPRGLVSQQELQNLSNAASASEAQLAAAQAQLGALATRLGETRLEAPFAGVVVARNGDPGTLVGAPNGRPVLTVARQDTLRAVVSLTEKQAPQVRVGQRADLRFDAFGAKVFEAHVDRLAPTFDAASRSLQVELRLPNPEGELRAGMYGRAEVELERHSQAVVVPAQAVQLSNEQAYVFILDGDVARRKAVVVGEEMGDEFEITQGVAAGAPIIVRGIDGLADGAKVRVSQAPKVTAP